MTCASIFLAFLLQTLHFTSRGNGEAPLDVCIVCERGKVVAADAAAAIDGVLNPALAVDTISTWDDGSVALARVSGPFAHTDGGRHAIVIRRGQGATGIFVPDYKALINSVLFYVSAVDANGSVWAIVDPKERSWETIKAAIVSNEQSVVRREVGGVVPLLGLSGAHPRLMAEIRWTFYGGFAGAELNATIENTTTAVTPQAVKLSALEIGTLDAAGARHPIATLPALSVRPGTRALFSGWVGKPGIPVDVEPDVASWARVGLCPPYDTAQPIPESAGMTMEKSLLSMTVTRPALPIGPHGSPWWSYPHYRSMGSSGDRAEIGHVCAWVAYALNGGGATARELAACADGCGIGAFSIHMRNPGAGWLGLKHTDPFLKASFTPDDPNDRNPNTFNVAHMPNISWVWLTQGTHYAADELASCATQAVRDNWPNNGLLQNLGQRREAWAIRQLSIAGAFLPDFHPLKAYYRQMLENSYARWETVPLNHPLGSYGDGVFQSSGRVTSFFTKYESQWQAGFFSGMLAASERMLGSYAGSTRLLDHNWTWWRGVITAKGKTWTAPSGEIIPFDVGALFDYSDPASIYGPMWKITASGGTWAEIPGSAKQITTFEEMAWWLRIQADHNAGAPTKADVPVDPDPMHARPASGVWTVVPGSDFFEYSMRTAIHRHAQARDMPDADAVAAEIEALISSQWAQIKLPNGMRVIEIR